MEEDSEFKLETKDLKQAMGLEDEDQPIVERKEETKEGVTVEASQLAKTKTKKKPAPKKEKVDQEIKKKEKAEAEAKKKEKAEADAKKKADKAEAAAKK